MANRRFTQTSRKRVTSWHGQNITVLNLVAGTPQFFTLISESVLETFPTPTLVRTRGRIMATTDVSSTLSSRCIVTAGIIKVTAAALAGSAVPTPLADVGSDWLWWDVFTIGDPEAATFPEIGSTLSVDRISIDSKAMRKVGLNEVLIIVFELTTNEGVMVANLQGNIRMLLKAP